MEVSTLIALDCLKLENLSSRFHPNLLIKEIVFDSKSVKEGYCYCCSSSSMSSIELRRSYLKNAVDNGAVAVISRAEDCADEIVYKCGTSCAFLTYDPTVITPRNVELKLLNMMYPNIPEKLAAVTGTNGKTSTVDFSRQLLGQLGYKAASFGTLGLKTVNCDDTEVMKCYTEVQNALTTFDIATFSRFCHKLVKEEASHLVLEASSEGLVQGRLDRAKFDIVVFTNITRDHLDYHKTMDQYFQAKALLLDKLKPNGVVILHHAFGGEAQCYMEAVRSICFNKNLEVWTYGENSGDLQFNIKNGSTIQFSFWDKTFEVDRKTFLKSLPNFLLENLLASIGIVLVLCNSPNRNRKSINMEIIPKILEKLDSLVGVAGRVQLVKTLKNGGHVYVDYAHTPDALKHVLGGLRTFMNDEGKLILVLGSGGNRDAGKRYEMGQISGLYSDVMIITDDNPRFEDPSSIRKAIVEGILDTSRKDSIHPTSASPIPSLPSIYNIGDRREAIAKGIELLDPNSILIVAGKGHEEYQIVEDIKIPFNDALVIKELVENLINMN